MLHISNICKPVIEDKKCRPKKNLNMHVKNWFSVNPDKRVNHASLEYD